MALVLCFSSSFRYSWADTVGNSVSFDYLDVTGVSYCYKTTWPSDYQFIDCTTTIADDGSTVFHIPQYRASGQYLFLRVHFSPSSTISVGDYLWFLNAGQSTTRYRSDGDFYELANFTVSPFDMNLISGFNTNIYSGSFDYAPDISSGFIALRSSAAFNGTVPASAISKFCIANGSYYDGAFEPGFDDEDGWLGGLIKAIIEGIQKIIDGITNLPENIANAVKGFFDMVVNAIVQLGQTILDGLKQLFIPSDGYFESVANDLSTFFSDRLGLLLYPFDFLVSLGDRIAGLQTGEPTCTIPEIAYTDADDNKYVLIEGQTLNVYDLVGRNDIIVGMHQTYLTVLDGIIAFTLMALCWKRFDHIIGGGAE